MAPKQDKGSEDMRAFRGCNFRPPYFVNYSTKGPGGPPSCPNYIGLISSDIELFQLLVTNTLKGLLYVIQLSFLWVSSFVILI